MLEDLEANGVERSYSADGDFASQLMAGVETDIGDAWRIVDWKTGRREGRFNEIQVLKPHLNTKPQVFYIGLNKEVR